MDSRTRVLTAINRQRPDRIPVDFWASRGFLRRLEAETGLTHEAFLDAHDVDVRYIAGPEYIGPPLVGAAGESIDLWGVPRAVAEVRVRGGVERYEEVLEPPLARAQTVEEVLAYPHWPSPDWFEYSGLARQCEAVLAKGCAVVMMGDRTNRVAQLKPAMYLRGMEQILIDMATNPPFAEAIFAKIRAFYLAYLERILAAARGEIDIVLTGDDFGAQDGLLVSPSMWDRYLREGFAQYVARIHAHGAKAMHHTCGSVRALVPRLVTCGLDVLQSLQPEARGMALEDLRAEFGHCLAFQGGVSIQRLMPFGAPDEIRAAVRHLAGLGRNGGYIFCTSHNVQADVPVANVEALFRAYREYGNG